MKFLMPRGQQSSPKERTVWDYLAKFFRNPEFGATTVTDLTTTGKFSAPQAFQFLSLTPGGTSDIDTGGGGVPLDWVVFGSVTVPSWATLAWVNMTASGIYPVTTVGGTYQYRIRIGGASGRVFSNNGASVLNERGAYQYLDQITLSGSGAQSLALQGTRASGTGAMRLDTGSDFTAVVQFIP